MVTKLKNIIILLSILIASLSDLVGSLGLSAAMLVGLLTALFFQPAFPIAYSILEGFGLIGASVDGVSIIQIIYSYLNNKEYVKQAYNEAIPIM